MLTNLYRILFTGYYRTHDTVVFTERFRGILTKDLKDLLARCTGLYFTRKFNQHFFTLTMFPHLFRIQTITFHPNSSFNHPIDYLPPWLKRISFGIGFDSSLTRLPSGLEFLSFHEACLFNQPFVEKQFPESLTTINLPCNYSHPLPKLSKNLILLDCGIRLKMEYFPANPKVVTNREDFTFSALTHYNTRLTWLHRLNRPKQSKTKQNMCHQLPNVSI